MPLPDPTSLVLVVVITNPRDLEIARLLGWYRIPFKSAPKVVSVDYLAFYQTAGFNEDERWRISFYARVRGHELTTRAELIRNEPDHPRAGEEYFKIQIGPLEKLSNPVHTDQWRRITFLYTTGELFNQALTIKDLVVRDEERTVLWQNLRDRALSVGKYHTTDLPQDCFDLDPVFLAMLGDLGKTQETQGGLDVLRKNIKTHKENFS